MELDDNSFRRWVFGVSGVEPLRYIAYYPDTTVIFTLYGCREVCWGGGKLCGFSGRGSKETIH